METLEVRSLTKDYGQGRGIYDVSFAVTSGECFGFLGPNGAGKSTTIRHLMGFARPQKGLALIDGLPTFYHREEVLQKVGYVPGEIALPNALTGAEFITEQKKLKGLEDETFLNWLLSYFELDASVLCKDMSLGMKRKLAIVVAFMDDPDILIMDEPSSGLDPVMQDRFIHLVIEEKKRKKTILLSSHIFSEIDQTADRIAVIKDGRIVSVFRAADLKHNETKGYRIVFATRHAYGVFSAHSSPYWKNIDNNPDELTATVTAKDQNINHLLEALTASEVTDFRILKTSLEEYFMSFYKEDRSFGGI